MDLKLGSNIGWDHSIGVYFQIIPKKNNSRFKKK